MGGVAGKLFMICNLIGHLVEEFVFTNQILILTVHSKFWTVAHQFRICRICVSGQGQNLSCRAAVETTTFHCF